ncbi:MAG: hypothetical protein OEU46_20010, partial [Alphaproteobacteria bacterium]|nr:hypothetical protein [Alphaproteobacteria bacterium]
MLLTRFIASILLSIFAGTVVAQAGIPFDTFVVGLRPVCATSPSPDCASAIGSFLDSNANGGVEIAEVKRARDRAKRSVRNNNSSLNSIERSMISVALMVFQHAGIRKVFANFDTDADGSLSQSELFADFRLDQRPFKDVIADPKGVDWKSFAARFGKVGFLITDLLPPSH